MKIGSRLGLIIASTFYLFGFARPASGHSADITRVQLQESPGASYQLEIEIPTRTNPQQTPEIPNRCRYTQEPEIKLGEQTTVLQFSFTCQGRSLGNADTLHFPWQTSGGLVVVRWQDGSLQSQFYAPGARGVAVALAQLQRESRPSIATLQYYLFLGIRHIFLSWNHILFAAAIVLVARSWQSVRLVSIFSFGHLLSLAIVWAGMVGLLVIAAEGSLILGAIAMIWIGRSPQKTTERWLLGGLFALGVLHGWGMVGAIAIQGVAGTNLGLSLLAFNVGIDAAQLVLVGGMTGAIAHLGRRFSQRSRSATCYALGGLAIVGLAFPQTYRQPFVASNLNALEEPIALPEPESPQSAENLTPDSPTNAIGNAPIASFITVEPSEVRHEILVRTGDIDGWIVNLDWQGKQYIEPEEQTAAIEQIRDRFARANRLQINGTEVEPIIARANFVTINEAGIQTRPTPVREEIEAAIVGITFAYLAPEPPASVTLKWNLFSPQIQAIAATISDPETSTFRWLTPRKSTLDWQNTLADFQVPTIEAIAATPPQIPVPTLSLLAIAAALAVDFYLARQANRDRTFAATRLAFPLAIVAYPIFLWSLPLPISFQSRSSPERAAPLLDRLLTNVYRAFEFRQEEAIYDKLAVSVTGDQLTEVYLDSRRALEVENHGGARARVDEVEVTEISAVRAITNDSLAIQAKWRVAGSVSHFGHTHFRHNQYEAIVTVTLADSVWKIEAIELIDEHRLL